MRITFSSRCDIFFVVRFYFYYEQQIKRELQGIHICGGRSNERLKGKTDGSVLLTYTVGSLSVLLFIFIRIKKGEGQGKESATLKL